MSKYPEVISEKVLATNAHISDDQIERDMADTEAEIANYRRLQVAEEEIARVHENPHERKMADFKARGRPSQIAEREDFVAFLERLKTARGGLSQGESPGGEKP